MNIKNEGFIENKTYRLLYPAIILELANINNDSSLIDKLNNSDKIAVSLKDINLDSEEYKYCLFILIAVQRNQYGIANLLSYIKKKEFFVTDYIFEENKHMIVLRIPKSLHNAVDMFLESKYSLMYTKEQINTYFAQIENTKNNLFIDLINKKRKESFYILTKAPEYVKIFTDKVNQRFGTYVEEKYFRDCELEYPIKESEEFFNYNV